MRRTGASLTKVAITARCLADCLTLKAAARGGENHVAIAMGPHGQITRAWPSWIGSQWTYAGAAAPGQIGVDDSLDLYRVRDTRATSAVYGIAGSPLGHSASPAMHNAAFAGLGMDALYVPLQTASADDFFRMADGIGLQGASVTIPLKQTLLTSRVAGDELVGATGAVNTLRRNGAGWEGRNFDVAGFLAPLGARNIALRDRHAIVLGSGGAARGAIRALASQGAKVRVSARRPEAASELAAAFRVGVADWPPAPGWDLLVNTTPVGMSPHVDESPLAADGFAGSAGKVVYDLVYNPAETLLLRLARGAGAITIGGLEMLVSQACRQFEWWTNLEAPRDVMETAAKRFLQARA
jgi:shikimate dehydrogenase